MWSVSQSSPVSVFRNGAVIGMHCLFCSRLRKTLLCFLQLAADITVGGSSKQLASCNKINERVHPACAYDYK